MEMLFCGRCGAKLSDAERQTEAHVCDACNRARKPSARMSPVSEPANPVAVPAPVVPPTAPGNPTPQENLNLYFCETCGKRVSEIDIAEGRARNKQLRGVYCSNCAKGVNTVEFAAITDESLWKNVAESRTPRRPGSSKINLPTAKKSEPHLAKPTAERNAAKPQITQKASPYPALLIFVAGFVILIGGLVLVSKKSGDADTKPVAVSPLEKPAAIPPRPAPTAAEITKPPLVTEAPIKPPPAKEDTPTPAPPVKTEPVPPAEVAVVPPPVPPKTTPEPSVTPPAPPLPPFDFEFSELLRGLRERPKTAAMKVAERMAERADLQPDGAQVLRAVRVLADQDDAKTAALAKLVGQTHTFGTSDGNKKGMVVSIESDTIQVQTVYSIGGETKTGKAFAVPISSITAETWASLLPKGNKTPDEKIALALQQMAEEQSDKAKALLTSLPASPFIKECLRIVDAAHLATQEKASLAALAKLEAAANPKMTQDEARRFRSEVEAWKKSNAPLAEKTEIAARLSTIIRMLDSIDFPKNLTLDLGGGVTLEMILVPAGEFIMGSNDNPNESPAHPVKISRPFYMSKYEITNTQWSQVINKKPGKDSMPLAAVARPQCEDFCAKLSQQLKMKVQLPTEAQWEYACRAGTTGPTYGELNKVAWHGGNSDKKQHPVGEKEPNAFGLYDMLGNEAEWVQDWLEKYNPQDNVDPTGPKTGVKGILRGGSFFMPGARASDRWAMAPNEAYANFGFRISIQLPPR